MGSQLHPAQLLVAAMQAVGVAKNSLGEVNGAMSGILLWTREPSDALARRWGSAPRENDVVEEEALVDRAVERDRRFHRRGFSRR